MEKEIKKYKEGHFFRNYTALSMAIFTGIAIPLSIILKMPALFGLGPAVGMVTGLLIAQSIESKYRKEGKIESLPKGKLKIRIVVVSSLIALGLIGLAIFLILTLR